MKATEKGEIASCLPAAEDRTGDHPQLVKRQFSAVQFDQGCADPGLYQRRLDDPGTGQGNDPLGEQLTCKKQMADSDDILIAQMPDGFVFVHRIDEMDMCAGQAGGM